MKAIDFRQLSIILILLTTVLLTNNAQNPTNQIKSAISTEQKKPVAKNKVTFIELGSVRCVPCKQMQPIMKSIQEKYASQLKVIFFSMYGQNLVNRWPINTMCKPFLLRYF